MADKSGQADIRGLDIDKLAKGFADEENVMKNHVLVTKTQAREIRWFQKTSGFLDSADTDGITATHIGNTSVGSIAVAVEQSWTRDTSYAQKFFVESPLISIEDIKDADVSVLATNVRDLVRAVARQVDQRIIAVLTNAAAATPTQPLTGTTTVQTTAATADGWNDDVTGNPILDILNGQQLIRAQGYDPMRAKIGMNSAEHKHLMNYLINTKGSSIPSFSSEKLRKGAVMEILGNDVIVSENFTTDWVVQWIPDRSVTWKSFIPITSIVMDDPGIGKKIRCWEEGEALLTDPNSVHVISDTIV